MIKKYSLVDVALWPTSIIISLFGMGILLSTPTYAFTKLKNGFDNLTETYLIPLSAAVAGTSFVLYAILSYFRPEENQKRCANVCIMSILTYSGLEIINTISQSFS